MTLDSAPATQPRAALHDPVAFVLVRGVFVATCAIVLLFLIVALGSPEEGHSVLPTLAIGAVTFGVILIISWNTMGKASRIYLSGATVQVACWRSCSFPLADIQRLDRPFWLSQPLTPLKLVLRDGREILFYASEEGQRVLAAHALRDDLL